MHKQAKYWIIVFAMIHACQTNPEKADLVLTNGKIVTVDDENPEVEAIAVRGKHIVAVGNKSEIQSYIDDRTEVIDLEGQLAIPGFIEGHGHFMRFGETLTQLDLRNVNSWDDIVERVRLEVTNIQPGEWIVGWGWHQDKWRQSPEPEVEGLPVHHQLSAISPDNPVLLNHTSGHGSFANAKALTIAGIDDTTADPEGGEVVRDAQGKAIGMLRETAADLVKSKYTEYLNRRTPEQVDASLREQVKLASNEAIKNGITSFQDMGSSFETIDFLKKMADERQLPIRLYMAIHDPAEVLAKKLSDYRFIGYGDGFFTVRCIGEKVLDGALGTHGGWLLEPYSDLPRTSGLNVTPVEDIRRSAELAVQHDFQMAIQGIGDKAARILFDIYETEFKKNPDKSDLRWRIEHAQVIHPDDLPRFAGLGVIPGVQGIFACSDGPWVVDRLGEERARERGYLFRTMLESGAVVMNGTDPPVEEISPIASFKCSVTRQLSDGSTFFPKETLTREQALRSYTYNNAYAAFEEDIKGSLEPGKLADITVLSQDILTVPDHEIDNTRVVYTIIDGKVVYRNQF